MEFDLHTHTSEGSACSRMPVFDLIQTAIERGLTGIFITDHDYCWHPQELMRLSKESGIQIYGGVELSTSMGEVLIYGVHQPLLHLRDDPAKLREFVRAEGGIMVAAHPFRQDFTLPTALSREECDMQPLELNVVLDRQVFKYVDALEVYNGRSSWREIHFAQQAAKLMQKLGTGGSDAHSTLGVGACVTVFQRPVNSEAVLLEEMRNGNYSARKGCSVGNVKA